jgi:hypothetical protein
LITIEWDDMKHVPEPEKDDEETIEPEGELEDG